MGRAEETSGHRKCELQRNSALREGERGSSDSLSGMGLSASDVSGSVSSLLSDTVKIQTKESGEEKEAGVEDCKMSVSPQTPKHTILLPRMQIFMKC